MVEDLLKRIQAAQDMALEVARLVPDGMYGKTAINLGWEALRLGWYMLRNDRVGIAEKQRYVQMAYDALVEELKERQVRG